MYTVSYLQSISFNEIQNITDAWKETEKHTHDRLPDGKVFLNTVQGRSSKSTPSFFFNLQSFKVLLRKSQARNSLSCALVFSDLLLPFYSSRVQLLAANNVKSQHKYDITHKRSNGLGQAMRNRCLKSLSTRSKCHPSPILLPC